MHEGALQDSNCKSKTPVIQPQRKIPAVLWERLRTSLDKMEQMNVIQKVDQPTDWANSIVIVEKPKTKELRI